MIDRTVVNNKYVVSTVRLAGYEMMAELFDEHGGRFETMVFPCDEQGTVTDWLELDCRRYHSAEAAREGHNDVVLDFLTK
jgi:hypothetical protein